MLNQEPNSSPSSIFKLQRQSFKTSHFLKYKQYKTPQVSTPVYKEQRTNKYHENEI
jgi:hypothetical protein